MFTLRQLEALVALEETASVSAASQKLEISQAAASALLAGFEKEIGLPILKNKRGTRAELTNEARQLVQPARNVLEHAYQLAQVATRMSSSVIQEVRVAARPHLVDQWLRQAAVQMEHETPNLAISITRGTNEEIIGQVVAGRALVGFIMIEEGSIALPFQKLAELSVGMYVARTHPLGAAQYPTPTEIAAAGFILPPKHTSLERRILERLTRAGIRGAYASARTEHIESLKLMTLAGTGIGIMFTSEVETEIHKGLLIKLPFALPPVEVCAVWQGALDESAQKLVQIAGELFARYENRLITD